MDLKYELVDLFLITPAVALFLASLIPLALKVTSGNQERNSFAVLLYGLTGVVAAAGLMMGMSSWHTAPRLAFDGMLVFDGVTTVAGMIIIVATAMALIFSRENLATNHSQFSEHVFLMLNAAAGMLLVTWANDLIFFFIGIELMSLCLYVLIAISSEDRLSKEASLKYFILGGFASAILLYGIAFVFGAANTTHLAQIAEVAAKLLDSDRTFIFGLVLVLVGICFKVSIFPFHAWTPDVYQGAPTPVTAFMATGVKTATFAMFLRLVKTDFLMADHATRLVDVLQWLAAITMLVGNIAAVMQTNLKRILAYSSVAHSGYIMIGLIVAGLSGDDTLGSSSVLFYLLGYSIMTIGSFGLIGILERDEGSAIGLADLKGLAKRRPWLSLCLTIFLLSLAGIPPSVGFFGKFFIFSAALKQGLLWLTIWGVISSVISVYFYLRPIVMMYMVNEEGADAAPDRYLSTRFVTLAAALVLLLGVFASPVMDYVTAALR